jgi:hypothetical protein
VGGLSGAVRQASQAVRPLVSFNGTNWPLRRLCSSSSLNAEKYYLLGYHDAKFGRSVSTFQGNILCPSAWSVSQASNKEVGLFFDPVDRSSVFHPKHR